VKTTDFSKQVDIRSESELLHHFKQLAEADPDLKWSTSQETPHAKPPWVELRLDERPERFQPLYLLKPSIPDLQFRLADWDSPNPPLLVVPELPARILDFCRSRRLAALDLNGRTYIRLPGLLIDRRPLPGRHFRFQLEPRNIFVGKSERIIRTLLTDRDYVWSQGELVERTRASSGLVSRIVQHLTSQGFIEKRSPRQFHLIDPLGLIDAWVKADDFNRRAHTTRYTVFVSNPFGIAQGLNQWAESQSVRIAFTQWIAAWLRRPYTEPVITCAYVDRLPEPATLERLALRPVSDAGKIWLHVPSDEGVFLETKTAQGLPIVSDAQIYLDLQQTGLRGPDQATALRDWEGFCRR
jgi:hypothetical protein